MSIGRVDNLKVVQRINKKKCKSFGKMSLHGKGQPKLEETLHSPGK